MCNGRPPKGVFSVFPALGKVVSEREGVGRRLGPSHCAEVVDSGIFVFDHECVAWYTFWKLQVLEVIEIQDPRA